MMVGLLLATACSPEAEEPETAEPESPTTVTVQPVLGESVPEVCLRALDEADEIAKLGAKQALMILKQRTLIVDLTDTAATAFTAAGIRDKDTPADAARKILRILDRADSIIQQGRSIADRLEANRYEEFANERRSLAGVETGSA